MTHTVRHSWLSVGYHEHTHIHVLSHSVVFGLSPWGPRVSSCAGWPGAPHFPCCLDASWKIPLFPRMKQVDSSDVFKLPADLSYMSQAAAICELNTKRISALCHQGFFNKGQTLKLSTAECCSPNLQLFTPNPGGGGCHKIINGCAPWLHTALSMRDFPSLSFLMAYLGSISKLKLIYSRIIALIYPPGFLGHRRGLGVDCMFDLITPVISLTSEMNQSINEKLIPVLAL